MEEVFFLIILGAIWLFFASICDIKTREIPNWLSFSLIIFALGARFFYSLFSGDYSFEIFYQGVIGIGVFFILGNLFYYGRVFAGGDAKLFIALGAVLGFNISFFNNLRLWVVFVFLIFLIGAFYGFAWSIYLSYKHFNLFKKRFKKNFEKNKKVFYFFIALGFLLFILGGLVNYLFFIYGFFVLVFPFIYIYAKSVDEGCMIKTVEVDKLTEGDWLYEPVKIGKGKKINPYWEGLSSKDIEKKKKHYKKVKIKEGIPFVPVFLISFGILVLGYFYNWFDSFLFVFF